MMRKIKESIGLDQPEDGGGGCRFLEAKAYEKGPLQVDLVLVMQISCRAGRCP